MKRLATLLLLLVIVVRCLGQTYHGKISNADGKALEACYCDVAQ